MENNELIQKFKNCKSAKEVKALAKESGYDLSDEKAEAYFDKLSQSGELADDELSNVSGGACFIYRKNEMYTIRVPHYLIVAPIKRCAMFKLKEINSSKAPDLRLCMFCNNLFSYDHWDFCCKVRTWKNDPLNR